MTEPLQPRGGEELLAEGKCEQIVGPLTFAGRVALSNKRVWFEPSSLSRLVGVGEWSANLDAIKEARFESDGGALVLVAEGTTRRLVGLAARVLHEALLPLLDNEPRGNREQSRVLLFATAEIEANDVLSASGDLTVTTDLLEFRLHKVDRLLWPALDLRVPLHRITGFSVTGIRRRLQVRWEGGSATFLGAVVPSLWGALRAAGDSTAADGKLARVRQPHEVWDASLYRGAIAHPGALVRTATQLAFLPTGAMDAIVGVENVIEMPLSAILGLTVTGRLDPRLEVTTPAGEFSFACTGAKKRYHALVRWLADELEGPLWLEGEPPYRLRALVSRALGERADNAELSAAFRIVSPAVRIGAQAIPGLLIMDDRRLTWLPADPAAKQGGSMAIDDGRTHLSAAPEHQLRMESASGRTYRWRFPSRNTTGPNEAALEGSVRGLSVAAAFYAEIAEAMGRTLPATGVASTKQPTGADRRRAFRVRIDARSAPPVSFSTVVDGVAHPFKCELRDLSPTGFRLLSMERLPKGERVYVDLLSSDAPERLEALVVHEQALANGKGWQTGLSFCSDRAEHVVRVLWMTQQRVMLTRMLGKQLRDIGWAPDDTQR